MRPPVVVVVLIHTWAVNTSGAVSVPRAKMRLDSFVVVRRAAVSPVIAPGWPQVTPLSERPSETPARSADDDLRRPGPGSFSGQ